MNENNITLCTRYTYETHWEPNLIIKENVTILAKTLYIFLIINQSVNYHSYLYKIIHVSIVAITFSCKSVYHWSIVIQLEAIKSWFTILGWQIHWNNATFFSSCIFFQKLFFSDNKSSEEITLKILKIKINFN